MKVMLRGLHSTDCPPQAAEHPVCTLRLTQQLQGEHKHISVLWIRKAMISSAGQAKTEEVLKVTSNLLHFF